MKTKELRLSKVGKTKEKQDKLSRKTKEKQGERIPKGPFV